MYPQPARRKNRLLRDPPGVVHSVLEQSEQVRVMRLALNFHNWVNGRLTSSAVEERQCLLPALNDPQSSTRGAQVAPRGHRWVGRVCGKFDPTLYCSSVLAQLTGEQRHLFTEGGSGLREFS